MLNYILNHLHFQRKDLIKNITKIYSPNFNARPSNININTVIIHYTELGEQDTIEHFCNKSSKVSSHFLINKNGKIYIFVELEKRAWHAGVSRWKDNHNINDNSIGIELENNGEEVFTKKQYKALIYLIKYLKQKLPIEDRFILGHSDIAPQRKIDPGRLFDWKILFKNKIGHLAKINLDDNKIIFNLGAKGDLVKQVQKSLKIFGYDILVDGIFGPKTSKVIDAFKAHYNPSSLGFDWDRSSNHILKQLLACDLK